MAENLEEQSQQAEEEAAGVNALFLCSCKRLTRERGGGGGRRTWEVGEHPIDGRSEVGEGFGGVYH